MSFSKYRGLKITPGKGPHLAPMSLLILGFPCEATRPSILYGAKIEIYTDHKNLTFKALSIKQILCWMTYINQYNVNLCYIPGKENVLADCFSWLPRIDKLISAPSISGRERLSSPQSVMNFDCANVNVKSVSKKEIQEPLLASRSWSHHQTNLK